MEDSVWVYRINSQDIITGYSVNFPAFAHDNEWKGGIEPEAVIGHSLFEFIAGLETGHLFQLLFEGVRRGKSIGPIPFRCDSPSERRHLELFLKPLPEGQIEITSKWVRSEARDAVRTLMASVSRSERIVKMCSMCKKMEMPPDRWVEIEEGLTRLHIFETEEAPQLSHGLCPACFEASMRKLD